MAREVKPFLFLVLLVSFSVLVDRGSSRKLIENLGDEEVFEADTNPMKEKGDTPMILGAVTKGEPQISSRSNPPHYISPPIALETLSETSLIIPSGTNSPVHGSRMLLEVRSDGSPSILSRLNPPSYAPPRTALGVLSKKSPKIPSRPNPHSYTPRELCEFKVPCKNSPQIPSGRNSPGSTPPHQALLGNLSKNSPRIPSGANPPGYIPPNTTSLGVQHKNSPKPSSEADGPAFIT